MHRGQRPLGLIEAFMTLKAEGGLGRLFKGSRPNFARTYVRNIVTLPLFDALC